MEKLKMKNRFTSMKLVNRRTHKESNLSSGTVFLQMYKEKIAGRKENHRIIINNITTRPETSLHNVPQKLH